jgi:uncharacterized membrane protein
MILQLIFGFISTVILMVALRKIKTIINQNPNLKESQKMMIMHLTFFLSNLVAVVGLEIVRSQFKSSP